MNHLSDSNILLRIADRNDPNHMVARTALRRLREEGHVRCIAPQNIIEFWSVSTRPASARGGLGLTLAEADRFVRGFRRTFTLLPETPAVFEEWHRLVNLHGVSRVQAHDARIAALMNVHGITHILTFNTTDFARYGLVAIAPASLI